MADAAVSGGLAPMPPHQPLAALAVPPASSRHDDAVGLGTADLLPGLRGRFLRGGLVVLAAQAGQTALHLLATLILARLLAPADFGLVAMVAAVTGFIGLLQNPGITAIVVQRPNINQTQISTLFWIILALGVALTALTALVSPLLASLYGDARLVGIALAAAPVFALRASAAPHRALLTRQMRLSALAVVDLRALAIAVAATILLALLGAGYWALALMPVIQATAIALGLWHTSAWRPGAPAGGSGVAPMLGFGANLTAVSVVDYAARQVDRVGIGLLYGPAALGYYSRGQQLGMTAASQLTTPLYNVIVPALSRLADDARRYRVWFYWSLALLSWVAAAMAVAAALWAPTLVALVFGDQWRPVAALLRNLAPLLALQPALSAAGWIFASRGEGRRYRQWALGAGALRVLVLLAALPFGVPTVALALSLATLLLILPWTLRCLSRLDPALATTALWALLPPLLTAATVAGIAAANGLWL